MRIVIIGSTGLIGSKLKALAVERGHHVVALSRRGDISTRNTAGIQYSKWDGETAADLVPLIDGADVIVNLAGQSIGKGKWTSERKAIHLSSRVTPALAVTRAWKDAKEKPSLLVQASAIGYYGTGEEQKVETSGPGNDYLANLAVKWEAASDELESLGCRRVTLRTGVVLDAEQGVLPQLMLPFKLMGGGPIGSGKQVLSWVHVSDEVGAIMYLIEKVGSSGVYNITAPEPVTNAEMGKAISRVTHLPYWFPVPEFAMKLALGEMSTLVLDGQKVLPARLLESGYKFNFTEIDLALKDLMKK